VQPDTEIAESLDKPLIGPSENATIGAEGDKPMPRRTRRSASEAASIAAKAAGDAAKAAKIASEAAEDAARSEEETDRAMKDARSNWSKLAIKIDAGDEAIRSAIQGRLDTYGLSRAWLVEKVGQRRRDTVYRYLSGSQTATSEVVALMLNAVGIVLLRDPTWDPDKVPDSKG